MVATSLRLFELARVRFDHFASSIKHVWQAQISEYASADSMP
jgi:hypothetical protein